MLRTIAAALRRVIGVPDYAAYVAHLRSCHPEAVPLDERDFLQHQMDLRYNRPGSRCC